MSLADQRDPIRNIDSIVVLTRIDMKHTLHRVSQSRVNWCLAIQSSDLMKSGEKRQPKPVRQIMGRSKNKARRGQKEKKKKKKKRQEPSSGNLVAGEAIHCLTIIL